MPKLPLHSPLCIALIAVGLSVAPMLGAGISSERMLARILQQTPAATVVPEGSQKKAAEVAAATIPGCDYFFGVGKSMEPLYSHRTAIVVAPLPYEDLRAGMTVVYLNSEGMRVAHSLTSDLPNGWIAQGVGNNEEDDELVTRSNLIGVVVRAFAEVESPWRLAVTEKLAAKGQFVARR